jgi:methyltransferase
VTLTPGAALAIFLALLVAERLFELAWSARNIARLRARGAVEYGRGHFPLFVAIHVIYPLMLAWEVLTRRAQPGPSWHAWLVVFVLAQALRVWAIASLGERWNVRVWVVPGLAPVRSGPYRFLSHPNYVAVVAELVAGPMMFGAWRTALAIGIANAAALTVRLRVEERALAEASPPSPTTRRAERVRGSFSDRA